MENSEVTGDVRVNRLKRLGSLNSFMEQSSLPLNPSPANGLLGEQERRFHYPKTVRPSASFVEAISQLV